MHSLRPIPTSVKAGPAPAYHAAATAPRTTSIRARNLNAENAAYDADFFKLALNMARFQQAQAFCM